MKNIFSFDDIDFDCCLIGEENMVLETGKDKIKKICDVLRKETLEPALQEAETIIQEARARADQILEDARRHASDILSKTEKEITKKQEIFQASLTHGARQTIDSLKQEIEQQLFHPALYSLIVNSTSSPEILSNLIKAIIKSIEVEGIKTDISAVIPSTVEARKVNELLGKEVLGKLREKSVLLGPMKGGVEIKLHKENISIDLTDQALIELLKRFIRKDFHQFFFTTK